MNENTEKRLVAFASQSFRQYGIRAVRMDDIARNMNISKRTLYQVYTTKDNLVNTCWGAYLSRTENMFHLIGCNFPNILACLWEISKAYVENLYKAEYAFWLDVSRYLEYKYIYTTYSHIWSAELGRLISACQQEKYIIPDLNVQIFLESFTTLLYNARIIECLPVMLHTSAYFMLRGIVTESGIKRVEQFKSVCKEFNKTN